MEVKKEHFVFGCQKCEKIAKLSNHHISKLSYLFNFCEKDLEKIALLLKKGVMCYYIDS